MSINYDQWKQETPPSGDDFPEEQDDFLEEQDDRTDEEVYISELLEKIDIAKQQVKELIEAAIALDNAFFAKKLKRIKL